MNHNILSNPPLIHSIDKVDLPKVVEYTSSQDIPVYEISKLGCEVIMIEVVFMAGRPQEEKRLAAAGTAALMREGAGRYSSEAMSEEIDYHGASLSIMAGMDFIHVRMVCLKKHYHIMIELVSTAICDPHFKNEELQLYLQKKVESLQIELAKNDVISYRELTSSIYGGTHPYGYNSLPEMYFSLETKDLKGHYKRTIQAKNCKIFVAGDVTERDRKEIDRLCRSIPSRQAHAKIILPSVPRQNNPSRSNFKANPTQTSIKIGRKTFDRSHKDHEKLNYVTTILGGYFGSRLVTRIREDLGLTYGIYANLDTMLLDGNLMIATEVANENVEKCLDEIYKEIDRLKTEKMKPKELQLVNNYLMGNYLNLFDGPFNSMKAIKSIALSGIPLSDLNRLIHSSVSITAEEVMETSEKYFNRNDFWEVIVGSPQMIAK